MFTTNYAAKPKPPLSSYPMLILAFTLVSHVFSLPFLMTKFKALSKHASSPAAKSISGFV
jgi:hypothetical protein